MDAREREDPTLPTTCFLIEKQVRTGRQVGPDHLASMMGGRLLSYLLSPSELCDCCVGSLPRKRKWEGAQSHQASGSLRIRSYLITSYKNKLEHSKAHLS